MGRGSVRKSRKDNDKVATNVESDSASNEIVVARTRRSLRGEVSISHSRATRSTSNLTSGASPKSPKSIDSAKIDDLQQEKPDIAGNDLSGAPDMSKDGNNIVEMPDETSETVEVNGPQIAEDGQSNSENCPLTGEATPVIDNVVQEDAQVEAPGTQTVDSDKHYSRRIGNDIQNDVALSQRDANLSKDSKLLNKSRVNRSDSASAGDVTGKVETADCDTETISDPKDTSPVKDGNGKRVGDLVEKELKEVATLSAKTETSTQEGEKDSMDNVVTEPKRNGITNEPTHLEKSKGATTAKRTVAKRHKRQKVAKNGTKSIHVWPSGSETKQAKACAPELDSTLSTPLDAAGPDVAEKCEGYHELALSTPEIPVEKANSLSSNDKCHSTRCEKKEAAVQQKHLATGMNGVGDVDNRQLDDDENGELSNTGFGLDSSKIVSKRSISTNKPTKPPGPLTMKTRARNKRKRPSFEEVETTTPQEEEVDSDKNHSLVKDETSAGYWEIVKMEKFRLQLRLVSKNSEQNSSSGNPKDSNLGPRGVEAKRPKVNTPDKNQQSAPEKSLPGNVLYDEVTTGENGIIKPPYPVDEASRRANGNATSSSLDARADSRNDSAADSNSKKELNRNRSQRHTSDNDKEVDSSGNQSAATKLATTETEPEHKQRMLESGEFDDTDINDDDPNRRKRSEQPAGVGLNRIRIAPVDEERTPGSISHNVVQTLLVKYGLLETIEDESTRRESEPRATAESHIKDLPSGTGISPVPNTEAKKRTNLKPATEATPKRAIHSTQRNVEVVATITQKRLVHDYKLPDEQRYRSNRPATKKRVLPPIMLDDVNKETIPRSLQHLSPELRIDILNRKSGRVLTGENAVAVKEVPNLLKMHASYEPIVPPPTSLEASDSNEYVREARSATRTNVCGTVIRQRTSRATLSVGKMASVKDGPNQGMMGSLEKVLPGGWVVVKKRYPRDGPKVLVRNDFVSSIDAPPIARKPGAKSERGRSAPNMSGSKQLQSIFMGSIKSQFRQQRANAASGVDLAMAKVDVKCQLKGTSNEQHPDAGVTEGDHQSSVTTAAVSGGGVGGGSPIILNNGKKVKKNGNELKQLATTALADVEELKRSEKAACAYAHSAFNYQKKQSESSSKPGPY